MFACGGGIIWSWDSPKSCLSLKNGVWNVSHNLLYERSFHTSWDTPDGGVMLIGGIGYGKPIVYKTELIYSDVKIPSKEMFDLKYRSMYVII